MIITFIVVGLIIASVVCFVIADNNWELEWLFAPGVVLAVFAFFAVVLCSVFIIETQVNKDVNYQNTLYEREMLEYRIENMEDNIVGNEMLYNDIVEFNNGLRKTKKYANSPWTNWFYNEYIAEIDYIELE